MLPIYQITSSAGTRARALVTIHKRMLGELLAVRYPSKRFVACANQQNALRTSTNRRGDSIFSTQTRDKSSIVDQGMTNKPGYIMPISTLNQSNKTNHRHLFSNGQIKTNNVTPAQTSSTPFPLSKNPNFQTMASIQKLAIEPTREHIENIRQLMRNTNAKDNDDQQVTLEKDEESGIGYMCIKSAAKNGISAKMMCDFLDIIDELYAWPDGKGVLIYGHNGFFCSGE